MKEIPQIVERTGISGDYWNEYWARTLYFGMSDRSALCESFSNSPVKKYCERYPGSRYSNVVNNGNRDRIARLDELAEICNREFVTLDGFDESKFKAVINEAHELIYGETEQKYYSD